MCLTQAFVTRVKEQISKEFLICFFCSAGHKKSDNESLKRVEEIISEVKKYNIKASLGTNNEKL